MAREITVGELRHRALGYTSLRKVIGKAAGRTFLNTEASDIFGPSGNSGLIAALDAGFGGGLAEKVRGGGAGLRAVAGGVIGELVARAYCNADSQDCVAVGLVGGVDAVDGDVGVWAGVHTSTS